MKGWSSLLRNRDGGLCVVCCCLLFAVVTLFGTWSARCFLDGKLQPLPERSVEIIAALGAVKGWQRHVDEHYGASPDAAGPPPAP